MRDKHQIIEELCEGKLSCMVLKTNEVGGELVEFNASANERKTTVHKQEFNLLFARSD